MMDNNNISALKEICDKLREINYKQIVENHPSAKVIKEREINKNEKEIDKMKTYLNGYINEELNFVIGDLKWKNNRKIIENVINELSKREYEALNIIRNNEITNIEKELDTVSIENIINEIGNQIQLLENIEPNNKNGNEKTFNQFTRELYEEEKTYLEELQGKKKNSNKKKNEINSLIEIFREKYECLKSKNNPSIRTVDSLFDDANENKDNNRNNKQIKTSEKSVTKSRKEDLEEYQNIDDCYKSYVKGVERRLKKKTFDLTLEVVQDVLRKYIDDIKIVKRICYNVKMKKTIEGIALDVIQSSREKNGRVIQDAIEELDKDKKVIKEKMICSEDIYEELNITSNNTINDILFEYKEKDNLILQYFKENNSEDIFKIINDYKNSFNNEIVELEIRINLSIFEVMINELYLCNPVFPIVMISYQNKSVSSEASDSSVYFDCYDKFVFPMREEMLNNYKWPALTESQKKMIIARRSKRLRFYTHNIEYNDFFKYIGEKQTQVHLIVSSDSKDNNCKIDVKGLGNGKYEIIEYYKERNISLDRDLDGEYNETIEYLKSLSPRPPAPSLPLISTLSSLVSTITYLPSYFLSFLGESETRSKANFLCDIFGRDNRVKINGKYIEIGCDVFQYPKRKVYVREDYKKIWEILKVSILYNLLVEISQVITKNRNNLVVVDEAIGKIHDYYTITKNKECEISVGDKKRFNEITKNLQGVCKGYYNEIEKEIAKANKIVEYLNKFMKDKYNRTFELIDRYKYILNEEHSIDDMLSSLNEKCNCYLLRGNPGCGKTSFTTFLLCELRDFEKCLGIYFDTFFYKNIQTEAYLETQFSNGVMINAKVKKENDKCQSNANIVISDSFDYPVSEQTQLLVLYISSPDAKNYNNYWEFDHKKELYLDVFNNQEIEEWRVECLPEVLSEEIATKHLDEIYGNVPRHIHFAAMFSAYFGRDYWDEVYTRGIKTVVADLGFIGFIKKYILPCEDKERGIKNTHFQLFDSTLSHYIVKYSFENIESVANYEMNIISNKVLDYVINCIHQKAETSDIVSIINLFNNHISPRNTLELYQFLIQEIIWYKCKFCSMELLKVVEEDGIKFFKNKEEIREFCNLFDCAVHGTDKAGLYLVHFQILKNKEMIYLMNNVFIHVYNDNRDYENYSISSEYITKCRNRLEKKLKWNKFYYICIRHSGCQESNDNSSDSSNVECHLIEDMLLFYNLNNSILTITKKFEKEMNELLNLDIKKIKNDFFEVNRKASDLLTDYKKGNIYLATYVGELDKILEECSNILKNFRLEIIKESVNLSELLIELDNAIVEFSQNMQEYKDVLVNDSNNNTINGTIIETEIKFDKINL